MEEPLLSGLTGTWIFRFSFLGSVLHVPPVRVELTTYSLEGSCSIQLSYGDADFFTIVP